MPKQKREIPVGDSVGAAVSGVVGAGVGAGVQQALSGPGTPVGPAVVPMPCSVCHLHDNICRVVQTRKAVYVIWRT